MKYFFLIFFIVVTLGIMIGANIYISKRFAIYFSSVNIRHFYFSFLGLTGFVLFGIIAFTNSTGIISNLVYNAAAVGIGVLLYLLLAVILMDIISLFFNIYPQIKALIVILLTVSISVYGLFNARNLNLKEVDIKIKGVEKPIKAMLLSDIHIGHWHGIKYLDKIVDATNEQKVDIVFITGDLFDGKIRLTDDNLMPLTKLKAQVFFVEGNHDGYSGSINIKAKLRKIGVGVLENEVVNWEDLQIVGLNHMIADNSSVDMHAQGKNLTVKNILPTLNINKKKPTILLHHSPNGVKYASESGVDLFLSGHTHAGQLFPITIFAKWMFPYNKGLNEYNDTKVYVSQGVGTFGPPMRVGTQSEIILINILPQISR